MDVKDSNCWTYFLSKAPYDVLVTIMENSEICLIRGLTGRPPCFNSYLGLINDPERCKKCLQKWLNEKTQ